MSSSNGIPKQLEAQITHAQQVNGGVSKAHTKRSAFGDLSNTAQYAHQSIAANGIVKHAAPASKPALKMVPFKDENKENAVKNGKTKDAFLRPPQRPVNGVRPSSNAQGLLPQNDYRAQPLVKQTRKATLVYSDTQQQKPQTLSRQYRSQPQLKSTEAQVVRRVQSKQAIVHNNNNPDEVIDEAPYKDALENLPRQMVETSAWKHLPGPIGPRITAEMNPLEPTPSAGPVPSMPEPEEYWDEDDEEDLYDEQGYTTAHSYRSYGDNTTGATSLIVPKRTVKVLRELEEARVHVEANRTPEEIDDEEWDTTMVAEYGDEIFEYMRDLEVSNLHAEAVQLCSVRTDCPY